MSTQPLVLYDVESDVGKWSPNTLKIRMSLNIKKLPYTTEWVKFNEIEDVAKRLGAKPTGTKPTDGTPWYTVPIVVNPSTGDVVSDSYQIAKYLDKTFPDSPLLIPQGTAGLEDAFQDAIKQTAWSKVPIVVLQILHSRLSGDAAAHVRKIREAQVGKTIEEFSEGAEAQWAGYRDGYGRVATWYDRVENSQFIGGGTNPTYADLVVASNLKWIKYLAGEDSKEWKDISSWHGGKWVKLIEKLSKYDV